MVSTERGDRLVAQLRAAADHPVAADAAATGLLHEFFTGYPLDRLHALLDSDDLHVVRAGAWLASELGTCAAPLLDDVVRLLAHPMRYVRFFAVDAVLANATPQRGDVTARAVALIDDSDSSVRWKTMQLLTNADATALAAAVPHLGGGPLGALIGWLTGQRGRAPTSQEIRARLGDSDRTTRLVAAAAAARVLPMDPDPMRSAAASPDEEIAAFAAEQLAAADRINRGPAGSAANDSAE
jgi:hypothetical protein